VLAEEINIFRKKVSAKEMMMMMMMAVSSLARIVGRSEFSKSYSIIKK
jgi:hypothetical protein